MPMGGLNWCGSEYVQANSF